MDARVGPGGWMGWGGGWHVSQTGVEVFSPVFWDNSRSRDVVSHRVH